MIELKGYRKIEYAELQAELSYAFADSDKRLIHIASELDLESTVTIKNAFKPEKQVVSDAVLTSVMKSIGLSGFIVWASGEKYYYIKNGKH